MDNLGFAGDDRLNSVQNPTLDYEKPKQSYTYEEAIALTGQGKFHYILLLATGFCILAVIVEILGVSLIIPAAKCDLKFSMSEQGILASSGFLGIVFSSHALGFLADTWGRLKVLRITLIFTVLSSCISAFSVNVWMLSVFRFFVGFFIAGSQACAYSYLGEFHGTKTRSRAVTFLSTFLPMGLVVVPALAIAILPLEINLSIFSMKFSSWRLLIILNSVVTLMGLMVVPFLPESPKYLLVQGHEEAAIEVLKKVFSVNSGRPHHEYPVKKITALETVGASLSSVKSFKEGAKLVWYQTAPLFYRTRVLITLNILFHMFMAFFIAHGIFMWFPGIVLGMVEHIDKDLTICEVVETLSLQEATISVSDGPCASMNADNILVYEVLVVMGVGYTAIYVGFGMVINYVGKKRLLVCWIILTGACGVAMCWTGGFYLNLVLMMMFMAVGNGAGIVGTIAMEFFPTNLNAMGMCLAMMTGRLGAVFGSNVIGIILSNDCNLVFSVLGGIVFVLSLFSCLLPSTGIDVKIKDSR